MTSKTTNKFAPEVRERAVWMVFDHERDHPSRGPAVVSIAEKIGCVPQTLHEWLKKAEVDSGKRADRGGGQARGHLYPAGWVANLLEAGGVGGVKAGAAPGAWRAASVQRPAARAKARRRRIELLRIVTCLGSLTWAPLPRRWPAQLQARHSYMTQFQSFRVPCPLPDFGHSFIVYRRAFDQAPPGL